MCSSEESHSECERDGHEHKDTAPPKKEGIASPENEAQSISIYKNKNKNKKNYNDPSVFLRWSAGVS